MKHYSQLTLDQRYIIKSMLKTGYSQTEIAKVLGVHKSTISRELKRNRGGRGYRYKQANGCAEQWRQSKIRLCIDAGTWVYIEDLIRQYFPKNRDFRTITDEELIHAMKRLNNRPRKRLGFKTPNEVFFSMVLINKMLHLLLESGFIKNLD